MSNMNKNIKMNNCAGCKKPIPDKLFLKCSLCDCYYDLQCANVPDCRFYNTMTQDHKKVWKCQACICRLPKSNNSSTPARPLLPGTTLDEQTKLNITMRKKPANLNSPNLNLNMENSNIDLTMENILGDTQTSIQPSQQEPNNQSISYCELESKTIEQISSLLDTKLLKMKTSILEDVKIIIQTELQNGTRNLQQELQSVTTTLATEQSSIKNEIITINKKIENIEDQLQELNELTNLKKIVIYGLNEPSWETENDLYNEICKIFNETMGININPYIEELKRIGKRGSRRPVTIEFISKRMTKHIMDNKRCFKGTGLAIEPFIIGKQLEQRKELSRKLRLARQNGHHAVIRSNKLIVDGKESHDYNAPEKARQPLETNNTGDTSRTTLTHYDTPTQLSQELQNNFR